MSAVGDAKEHAELHGEGAASGSGGRPAESLVGRADRLLALGVSVVDRNHGEAHLQSNISAVTAPTKTLLATLGRAAAPRPGAEPQAGHGGAETCGQALPQSVLLAAWAFEAPIGAFRARVRLDPATWPPDWAGAHATSQFVLRVIATKDNLPVEPVRWTDKLFGVRLNGKPCTLARTGKGGESDGSRQCLRLTRHLLPCPRSPSAAAAAPAAAPRSVWVEIRFQYPALKRLRSAFFLALCLERWPASAGSPRGAASGGSPRGVASAGSPRGVASAGSPRGAAPALACPGGDPLALACPRPADHPGSSVLGKRTLPPLPPPPALPLPLPPMRMMAAADSATDSTTQFPATIVWRPCGPDAPRDPRLGAPFYAAPCAGPAHAALEDDESDSPAGGTPPSKRQRTADAAPHHLPTRATIPTSCGEDLAPLPTPPAYMTAPLPGSSSTGVGSLGALHQLLLSLGPLFGTPHFSALPPSR
jgi:hypothetical protein